jgi:hypothetical protein
MVYRIKMAFRPLAAASGRILFFPLLAICTLDH